MIILETCISVNNNKKVLVELCCTYCGCFCFCFCFYLVSVFLVVVFCSVFPHTTNFTCFTNVLLGVQSALSKANEEAMHRRYYLSVHIEQSALFIYLCLVELQYRLQILG